MFDLDEFLHHFERVRERTRRWPRAFRRSTWNGPHIAVTERFIWAETVHNRPVAYMSHGRELADGLDAVLAFFDHIHEESLAQFRALTPSMLEAKCVTPAGTPLTTWKWLRMMPEHEIHHRGQLYTMLAMLNVPTPPIYGMTAAQVQERSA
jgi:uncharacterized damage-inducible protein DinB